MEVKELKATTQKSYYGKALLLEDGNSVKLRSYETIICEYNTKTKEFKKIWQGWSKTTAQHINDFRRLFGLRPVSKKEWLTMEAEEAKKELYIVKGSNGCCEFKAQPIFDNYETAEKFADELTSARNGWIVYYVEKAPTKNKKRS